MRPVDFDAVTAMVERIMDDDLKIETARLRGHQLSNANLEAVWRAAKRRGDVPTAYGYNIVRGHRGLDADTR